ncbi:xylulokinase, partial [Streptomyces laculatispora]|nr:xylulokinase [Streptomyces laculatispora]
HPLAARPLLLIGGGARGHQWVETVRRLSGRPVTVPAGGELVAMGAAALAASAVTGRDPVAIATGWQTGEDPQLEAVERDLATWARIGSVLDRASQPLLGADRPRD